MDQFVLTKLVVPETTGVSLFYRALADEATVDSLERVLSYDILNETHVLALQNAIQEEESHNGMLFAFAGDRCQGVDLILSSGGFGPVTNMPNEYLTLADSLACFVGVRQVDFLNYLNLMKGAESALAKSYPERVSATEEWREYIEKRWPPASSMIARQFTRSMTAPLSAVVLRDGVKFASLRIAGAALAVERYRLAKGRWPEQLQDTVPEYLSETPTDPFTGDPFTYRATGNDCVIYGPGMTGKDFGGRGEEEGYRQHCGDVVFRIRRISTVARQPAVAMPVLSRKTILEFGDRDVLTGPGEASISPAGEHLLFHRRKTRYGGYQPTLLNLVTGVETTLPFSSFDSSTQEVRERIDNAFSAKGNYVFVPEDGQARLYDIRSGKSHDVPVPNISTVVGDEAETSLFFTSKTESRRTVPGPTKHSYVITKYASTMYSLDEGASETLDIKGIVSGMARKDRAAVLIPNSPNRPDWGAEFAITNLENGTVAKSFGVSSYYCCWPAPFWVGDRFFCFSDDAYEKRENRQFRFWDTTTDRTISLRNTVAFAPGANEHTVLIVTEEGMEEPWRNLRVLDMSSRRQWKPEIHDNETVVCAYGRFVVCAVEGEEGTSSLALYEIAPTTAVNTLP